MAVVVVTAKMMGKVCIQYSIVHHGEINDITEGAVVAADADADGFNGADRTGQDGKKSFVHCPALVDWRLLTGC